MPKFDYKKCYVLEGVPAREPPASITESESWILIGGLFKIEGRPFRAGVPPGVILEAKMDPKWTSKSTQKCLKTHLKNRSEILP